MSTMTKSGFYLVGAVEQNKGKVTCEEIMEMIGACLDGASVKCLDVWQPVQYALALCFSVCDDPSEDIRCFLDNYLIGLVTSEKRKAKETGSKIDKSESKLLKNRINTIHDLLDDLTDEDYGRFKLQLWAKGTASKFAAAWLDGEE